MPRPATTLGDASTTLAQWQPAAAYLRKAGADTCPYPAAANPCGLDMLEPRRAASAGMQKTKDEIAPGTGISRSLVHTLHCPGPFDRETKNTFAAHNRNARRSTLPACHPPRWCPQWGTPDRESGAAACSSRNRAHREPPRTPRPQLSNPNEREPSWFPCSRRDKTAKHRAAQSPCAAAESAERSSSRALVRLIPRVQSPVRKAKQRIKRKQKQRYPQQIGDDNVHAHMPAHDGNA